MQSALFANKPNTTPLWTFSVQVVPMLSHGIMTEEHIDNFSKWKLQITLGDTLVFNQAIAGKMFINKDFADSKEPVTKDLVIELQSAPAITAGQCLHIKIMVEGIDITPVLVDQQIYHLHNGNIKYGADHMGEVGKQILPMSLPIYRWLFEHEE